MKIAYEGKESTHKLQFNGTVAQLLNKLKVPINTILVAKNGILLTEDDELENSDEVLFLSVISGG